MHKSALLLLFATIVSYPAPPTTGAASAPSDYQALVSAERSFADFTSKHGIKAGFTRYLAEEALVVVKGRYQLDKPIYEKMPEPAQSSVLSWWPVYADIAASGDFGYTTGPFEVRPKAAPAAPVAFGQFTSVWRKTSSGEWKVVADLGITHAAPNQLATTNLLVPAGANKAWITIDTTSSHRELLKAEIDMAHIASSQSLGTAYAQVLAPTTTVRLYRTGSQPHVGPAAIAFAATQIERATYTSVRAVAATSGDLGFTYGYAQYQQLSGPFLRIWKRQANGTWQLVHEVADLH